MSHCDPISDMLTRVRNAIRVERNEVNIKATRVCEGIARVLQEQGYIIGYDCIETANKQDILRLQLKYGPLGEKVINEIKRCSKPSCRRFCRVNEVPRILGGMGIAVVSTNKGVLSDQQCRERNLGGELLCTVC